MPRKKTAGLFESAGFSVEYLVVERDTLAPRAMNADETRAMGNWSGVAADDGELRWTTAHPTPVLCLSTARQVKALSALAKKINGALRAMNEALGLRGLMLLPGALHPLLEDARGQGARLELPFSNDGEFGKLHTAIRMVLPIIPALAAGSPFARGRVSGSMDTRGALLRSAAARSVERAGAFIPESVTDQEAYYRTIYQPMAQYAGEEGATNEDYGASDLRAATANFDTGMITIHATGGQECARADLAIAEMITAVVKAMVESRWVSNYLQRAWHESDLLAIYADAVKDGGTVVIGDRGYLLMLGMVRESATGREIWQHLFEQLQGTLGEEARGTIAYILENGDLAGRLLARTGSKPAPERILEAHREMAACLSGDRLLGAQPGP